MFVVTSTGTALQKLALKFSTVGLLQVIDNDVLNKFSGEVAAEEQLFVTVADVVVMLAAYSSSKSATLVQHLDPNEKESTHKNIKIRIIYINAHVNKEIEPKICRKSEESLEILLRSPFRVDVLPHVANRKKNNGPSSPIDFNFSTEALIVGDSSIETLQPVPLNNIDFFFLWPPWVLVFDFLFSYNQQQIRSQLTKEQI